MWQGPVANWIKACLLIEDMDVDLSYRGTARLPTSMALRGQAIPAIRARPGPRRYDAGMSAFEAAKDIELAEYSAWSDPERIAVNVDSLYREFSGEDTLPIFVELFSQMAELAGFGAADQVQPP